MARVYNWQIKTVDVVLVSGESTATTIRGRV